MASQEFPKYRPRRSEVRVKEEEPTFVTKFSLADKKRLLAALRKHHPDDLSEIQAEFLPYRTEKEIEWYIQRIRLKPVLLKQKDTVLRVNAPLENWLRQAEELMSHAADHSFDLTKVFDTIANMEQHDVKVQDTDPDWKMIYRYIIALLRGNDAPPVGQIEAYVLLDLMDNLTRFLQTLETTDQRRLMKRKFELLNMKSGTSAEDRCRAACRALQNDLSETERNQNGSEASTSSSSTSAQPQSSIPPTSGNTADPGSSSVSATATANTDSLSRNAAGESSVPRKMNEESSDTVKNRGPGKKRLRPELSVNTMPPQQKGPLYYFNPFCIPFEFLVPRSKQTGSVLKATRISRVMKATKAQQAKTQRKSNTKSNGEKLSPLKTLGAKTLPPAETSRDEEPKTPQGVEPSAKRPRTKASQSASFVQTNEDEVRIPSSTSRVTNGSSRPNEKIIIIIPPSTASV